MRLPVTIGLVVLALGCAPASLGAARIQARVDGVSPAATAEVAGASAAAVLGRAALVLEARGLRIASCEPARIVTAPRELDVPCGAGTCLARELVVVRVADRSARVEILRGVWEPTARAWAMALARSTATDAAEREAEILRAIVEPVGAGTPSRAACPPRNAAISLAPPRQQGDRRRNSRAAPSP